MSDLTLLYYSSNALPENVANNFRKHLLGTTENKFPIVSVTQKPISLGENICLGEIGQSYYNLYRQMYAGILRVRTKYAALVEDDSLYTMEHFSHRPPNDETIICNKSIWFLDKEIFWTKKHAGGFAYIVATDLAKNILAERFKKFPEEPMPRSEQKHMWLEIGKEERLGLKPFETEFFETEIPLVTLCYWQGTHGWPKRNESTSVTATDLDYWGNAKELRNSLFS